MSDVVFDVMASIDGQKFYFVCDVAIDIEEVKNLGHHLAGYGHGILERSLAASVKIGIRTLRLQEEIRQKILNEFKVIDGTDSQVIRPEANIPVKFEYEAFAETLLITRLEESLPITVH